MTLFFCYLQDGDGLLVNEDFTTVGSWCDADGDTFLVADPNGDHHDDWICRHGDGSICTKYNAFVFRGKSFAKNVFIRKNVEYEEPTLHHKE